MADPPLKSQELEALEAAVRSVCALVWPPTRSDLDALKCELATYILCFGALCEDGRRRVNAALAGSHLTNFWKRYAASRPIGACAAKWGKLKQLMAGESRFDLECPVGRPSNLEVFVDCRDVFARATAEGWLENFNQGMSQQSSNGAAAGCVQPQHEDASSADDQPPGISSMPASGGASSMAPPGAALPAGHQQLTPGPGPQLQQGSLDQQGTSVHAQQMKQQPQMQQQQLQFGPLPAWDAASRESVLAARVQLLQRSLLEARSQALEANRASQAAQETLTRVLGQLGAVQAQLIAAQEQMVQLRHWAEGGRGRQ